MDVLNTRRPRVLLVAFCLMLWLPGFFSIPATDRDESRFAQATKQMLETGDYVRIMNGAEARNRKPIGIYWLQVPFVAAGQALGLAHGNPVWPYRLPSLLGGLVAVLAVERYGRELVGARASLLAAAMLGACILLIVEVHLAKTDAALLGATTLCLGLLARAYLRPDPFSAGEFTVFWLAMGVGILIKGPITPMIAGLTALTLSIWDRQAGWLGHLRPAWGCLVVALVVLPWFIAIALATHGAFFSDAIAGDLGGKLAGSDDAHGAPPGLHALLLPILTFPSSAFVIMGLAHGWRGRDNPTNRFLLAWVLPAWFVFEIVPTKLPHYTLPIYPALFLLAAGFVLQFVEVGWFARVIALWGRLFAHVALIASVGLAPVLLGQNVWLSLPVVVALCLIPWAVQGGPTVGLAGMVLVSQTAFGWVLPQLRPLWIAPQVQGLLARNETFGRLGSVGYHEPSLMLAAGTSTVMFPTASAGAKALATHTVEALLVSQRDLASFKGAGDLYQLHYIELGSISGFNYSRGQWTTLHLFTNVDH